MKKQIIVLTIFIIVVSVLWRGFIYSLGREMEDSNIDKNKIM